MSRSRKFVSGLLDLFGNFSFRTGYLKMRCSKSCYLRDLELVDLFDNGVIEQVYFYYLVIRVYRRCLHESTAISRPCFGES